MSMNLNIPITQTITLPDSWQACKTPQELSYWIIAKFDNFTTQFTEINNAMSALQSMIETNTANIATNDAKIAEIKNTLTSINSDIATLQTDYNTLNTDLTTLYGQHQQLSNKVASMEDAVLDLPGIKNDISTLHTAVIDITTGLQEFNLPTMKNDISELQTNVTAITADMQEVLSPIFYADSNETIMADNNVNMKTIVIYNSHMDYRQFILNTSSASQGLSFIIYYKSPYNVPFGHFDPSKEVGPNLDIVRHMSNTSIDGNITLDEVKTKTNVAIQFFMLSLGDPRFEWAVL